MFTLKLNVNSTCGSLSAHSFWGIPNLNVGVRGLPVMVGQHKFRLLTQGSISETPRMLGHLGRFSILYG